jgi:hypothetical protein
MGIKATGYEADHLPPSDVKAENDGVLLSQIFL